MYKHINTGFNRDVLLVMMVNINIRGVAISIVYFFRLITGISAYILMHISYMAERPLLIRWTVRATPAGV